MKIALVTTDSDIWGLGIRLISSVLRKAGHSTRLLLLPSEAQSCAPALLDEIWELVKETDYVGISCYSKGFNRARQIAKHLRGRGKLTVWGGLHATLNPRECAEAADIVCRGEGEGAIVELTEMLESGRPWKSADNLAWASPAGFAINPVRPPVDDLDQLPSFDFEGQDEFHLTKSGITRTAQQSWHAFRGPIPAIGSRGCANHCTYCCNRQIRELYGGKGKYLRRMSIRKYVEQIETLHKKHFPRATSVYLLDEDFFLRSAAELRAFSVLYRERVGLPFQCLASAPRITAEKLEYLAQAGLYRLLMGVESGSERTKQAIYERNISNEVVSKAAHVMRCHPGIVPCYFFILGNPYEGPDDLLETLRFMSGLPYPFYINTFNLILFPGSALYGRALRDGVITGPQGSGRELYFSDGYQYKNHAWKQKNLYLNALLFLTEGKVTRFRLGLLPRVLLPFLTNLRLVRFASTRTGLAKGLIAAKTGALAARRKAAVALQRIVRDPAGIYSLPLYLLRLFSRAQRAADAHDRGSRLPRSSRAPGAGWSDSADASWTSPHRR